MNRMLFVPRETRRHMMAAMREGLLASRSLLDAGVERIERQQQGTAPQPEQPAEEQPRQTPSEGAEGEGPVTV